VLIPRIVNLDSDLDLYTTAVPDHIRQSIIRLTEQQRSEEEAERELEREEAKARRSRSAVAGPSSRAKEPRIRTVAFEEELDGDDLLADEADALEARVRLNLREGEEGSSDGESYVNSEEDVSALLDPDGTRELINRCSG
jgi:hypothetical protein